MLSKNICMCLMARCLFIPEQKNVFRVFFWVPHNFLVRWIRLEGEAAKAPESSPGPKFGSRIYSALPETHVQIALKMMGTPSSESPNLVVLSMICWSYHPANGAMESNLNILFQRTGQNKHVPSPEMVHLSNEQKGPLVV